MTQAIAARRSSVGQVFLSPVPPGVPPLAPPVTSFPVVRVSPAPTLGPVTAFPVVQTASAASGIPWVPLLALGGLAILVVALSSGRD